MTPEEAAHHGWLSEIKHRHPKIVDRSWRSPAKLMSVRDEANGNDCGKVLRMQFITKDVIFPIDIT